MEGMLRVDMFLDHEGLDLVLSILNMVLELDMYLEDIKQLYLLLVLVLMVQAKQPVQQLVLSQLLSLSLRMLNLLLQLTLFLPPMLLVIDP